MEPETELNELSSESVENAIHILITRWDFTEDERHPDPKLSDAEKREVIRLNTGNFQKLHYWIELIGDILPACIDNRILKLQALLDLRLDELAEAIQHLSDIN